MSGLYLHSPRQSCGKDCCLHSSCMRKGEAVVITGRPVDICMHTTGTHLCPQSLYSLSPNTQVVHKSPAKALPPTHIPDCKKAVALACPYPRCEKKFEDLSQHFFKQHDFVRVGVMTPMIYRLKNITRDMFLMYEPRYEVFVIGNIEERYQKYISFELQIVYDYVKRCCGHPRFTFTIPNVVTNAGIELYKNKYTIGKSLKKIEILKDKLKRANEYKFYYELEIILNRC